jgi:hypothetical protein
MSGIQVQPIPLQLELRQYIIYGTVESKIRAGLCCLGRRGSQIRILIFKS